MPKKEDIEHYLSFREYIISHHDEIHQSPLTISSKSLARLLVAGKPFIDMSSPGVIFQSGVSAEFEVNGTIYNIRIKEGKTLNDDEVKIDKVVHIIPRKIISQEECDRFNEEWAAMNVLEQ